MRGITASLEYRNAKGHVNTVTLTMDLVTTVDNATATESNEDIKTKEELAVVMKKRGIWGDEQQKEEIEIVENLAKLEKQLYLGDGKKKIPIDNGKKIADRVPMKTLGVEVSKDLFHVSIFSLKEQLL